jgi:ABC-type transport system involved in cytochrome c biogenesis permease subunit
MLKLTLQGGLIYLTLAFFIATVVALSVRRRDIGRGFWFAGFLAALASVVWRGLHTGHPPMQNLFEFFLCMGAALWPLSQWSRRRNGVDTDLQDAVLGALILIPAGFVFSEEIRRLPPALQSPIFIPHVASYVAGYVMLARAALMALPLLRATSRAAEVRQADAASRQTAVVGFLLLTLGLLLGSLWGKICWGHYWQWDPKEMWSLATWFIYVGYFHYRLAHGLSRPKALGVWLWLGLLFVVLTLTWINLSRMFSGMHTYA